YPDGRFAATAKRRAAAIEQKISNAWVKAERLRTKAAYEAYLAAVGCESTSDVTWSGIGLSGCSDEHLDEARNRLADLQAFANAERVRSADAYAEYLISYPDGLFAGVARRKCQCQ